MMPKRQTAALALACLPVLIAPPARAQDTMLDILTSGQFETMLDRQESVLRGGYVDHRAPSPPPGATDAKAEGTVPQDNRGLYIRLPPDATVFVSIQFRLNSAEILPEAEAQLAELCRALTGRPGLRLNLFGHTDTSGSDAHNLALSDARAAAVRQHLVGRCAIAPDRLYAVGMGETAPLDGIAPTSPQNRRVEFQVIL